ncbi:MAG: hypothetical protein SF066_21865 [Thermoanaerobaculia bacterium]|nr:hypothetical protein [Thermoanaerobaculia bacterium]
MAITVDGNQVTIRVDTGGTAGWKSLTVNGQSASSFPASLTATAPVVFQANYKSGRPAVPQAPMVLTGQGSSTGDVWLAVVDFADDGDGGCNVSGTVSYGLSSVKLGNPLQFSAYGLTGRFEQKS